MKSCSHTCFRDLINGFRHRFRWIVLPLLIGSFGPSYLFAQWKTESFELEGGWQAIYLRVDTEERTIESVLGDYPQIEEIWRWLPKALDQRIVDSPDNPTSGVEWQIWKRNDRANTSLSVLYANSAYLVKVADGAASFSMGIKGRVTSPTIYWRTDGLNLVGFPTNPSSPPTIEAYLSPAEVLDQLTEIYGYTGGPLQANINPQPLTARSSRLNRGTAYWMRTTKYADYDGPLRVRAAIGEGVDFGASRPTVRIVMSNRTDRTIDAILTPVESEPAPGETMAPQAVPLTRLSDDDARGAVYESFDGPITVRLRANETLGMTLGIDRSRLMGTPGDEAFSLVKVNDGDGLSEFYVPAHAEVASLAGLWVGEAEVTHVQNQLQRFQKDDDGVYLIDDSGRYIPEYKKDDDGRTLLDEGGDPIPDSDTELNQAAQVFRLRLILHVDDSGQARLLSRAYIGAVGEDRNGLPVFGVSTNQDVLLPKLLGSATRISAAHLPKETNLAMAGDFDVGGQLTAVLAIAHDDPSNPFIHTYHPDHDNLDARFENPLPEGVESHRIDRAVALTVHSEAGTITDPMWGTTLFTGAYSETVAGLHKNPIAVQGIFALRRISEIPQITSSN